MDIKMPPPLPTCNHNYHVEFRCNVDKRQYIFPIVIWCVFDIIILAGAPGVWGGIFGILFSSAPLFIVLFSAHCYWSAVTYNIDNKILRISTPLKSLIIKIENIKKIRRGKFWVERGRNYSASYIKLRIIYDNNRYIYVSPENEEYFVDILKAINPNIIYSSERNL